MKISIGYTFKDAPVEESTATILIEDISVSHIKRVLRELSEITVNDFAKLGAVSAFPDSNCTDREIKNVESFLKQCCSPEEDAE